MRSLMERGVQRLVVKIALAVAFAALPGRTENPVNVPVADGRWKGPSASSFNSALRRGLAKDCVIVGAKRARAILDGEVVQDGKAFTVRVIVKSAKSGEVAEQREFPFAKASVSSAQANRMGRAVADMVRR